MPIEIVQSRRLYRQVADQLRALIANGEYPPGSRLPAERELSIQLGISRPTVREALIALEVEGYVRIKVGAGIFVEQPASRRPVISPEQRSDAPGAFALLSARALFEGAIAGTAARLARPSHIRGLDLHVAAMRAALHPGRESSALDRAFHIAVADILDNDVITRVVGELFDQRANPYFAQLASHFENADSWTSAVAEHAAVRDAIKSGDAIAATNAMTAHLEKSQARFALSFGDGTLAQPTIKGIAADPAALQPKKSKQRK